MRPKDRPSRSGASGRLHSRPAAAACLFVALLVAAAPARAQFTPLEATLARFDAEVAEGVAEDGAGAVSMAVFRGDEVIWAKGWGWADIEVEVPATAETIGRTGSISKTFTAALMGRTDVALLSEGSRREMRTAQEPAEGYGLGLSVREVDGVRVIGHGGSVAGYNAALAFDPESELGVAMLRTTGYDPPVRELLVELARGAR